MAATLLIELFTEELPPRALRRLGEAFAESVAAQLQAAGLAAGVDGGLPRHAAFATPRRLAVSVADVAGHADARAVEVKGPSVAVGLDAAGAPTKALLKWAEKQGASVDALFRAADGKQECFFFRSTVEGARLAGTIQRIVDEALAKLPIPKLMNYQLADGHTTVGFVRPAHRLTVLHGAEVLDCRALGLAAGRTVEGHRFLGGEPIVLRDADSYAARLRAEGRVVASFAERRAIIADALLAQAESLGASLGIGADDRAQKDALLDEVTALVEWPVVYIGRFDEAFLAVPQECLILTMRTNQKYFPLFAADGRLLSHFLIVSNMAIDDPSAIIAGNERVVRPRLADARFFYEQDRKATLESRLPQLAQVVYHARLGTQADRAARVGALTRAIATLLGRDVALAERAALLAKADLVTGMVGEFPELQGIMGRYYALHDGEPAEVADAIAQHYQPRFSGDALPASPTGTVLALADKLETLAGIWGIGQQPSGDKDPFALRRQALGVVRMLVEQGLALSLTPLIAAAFGTFDAAALAARLPAPKDGRPAKAPAFAADVAGLQAFVVERLRGYLRERGFAPGDIDAVVARDAERLDRVEARLQAVRQFRELPEAGALAAANKRIANILRKSGPAGDDATAPAPVEPARLVDAAEVALHRDLVAADARIAPLVQAGDYGAALRGLAGLRPAVDAFFDQVMVNADDPALRANRLALLGALHRLMNQVADLSRL